VILADLVTPRMTDQVAAALRGLPSHGWARGMFGRRDRCLLVQSQLAGVPYKDLATLTVGDITLIKGTARIRCTVGAWVLRPAENPLLCGPCAVTRWLRALDLDVTWVSPRVLARSIRKAAPVTNRSPHLCRSTDRCHRRLWTCRC
jgi:rubredoxin